MYVSLSLWLYISMSVCLSIYLSYLFIYLSVGLPVCLSVRPSIHPIPSHPINSPSRLPFHSLLASLYTVRDLYGWPMDLLDSEM